MVAAGVGGIANGIGGIGAAAAPSAPAGQPKKRGRGRPKGSKNKPKPPSQDAATCTADGKGNAARTIQSAIRARLLDSMTLPVRAFSELPPEVEDPAQFHFNRADWKIIPRDIQQHAVRRITDSNDPAGLNLRAMIRALGESVKRGGLPLYLLRRKKLRYGTLNSSYIYRPTLNRVKDQKFTKSLPDESNSGDDLAGYYFTQIFHSIGNILQMDLNL